MTTSAQFKSPESRERSLANLTAHKFQPGQSGNPGGSTQGARRRLQGTFLRRLSEDFERFGMRAIARCRRYHPDVYLRVCASLMPKELEVKKPLDDISDDELLAAIEAVRVIVAARDSGAAAADARGGSEEEGELQSAAGLPPVSEAG